ncbi:MAG TPA: MATE family efflux transporter, partial [Candidatus Merdenecus merdavium]|nr:MATE family efflux transporter [Candidatus Merdenecus merdavium]
VSQSLGCKDVEGARKYSQISLMLSIVLGIAFATVMILFKSPLIGFFNIQDPMVVADTEFYLTITSFGIPATFITAVMTGTYNAYGNSKTPFYINVIGLASNMILDPVFIFLLKMGITGAAIATVLAQNIVMILCVVAIKYFKNRPFQVYSLFTKLEKDFVKTIIKWSTPVVLESMFFSSLSMIISRFIAAFGTSAMAVSRVGSQVESLTWLVGGGFATGITSFIGQNYGAKQWERIHKGYWISIRLMMIWGGFITALLLFGGSTLMKLFLIEPTAIQIGIVYLKILSICQLVACMEYASAGAFRGLGKTVPPSMVSITGNLIRIFIIYFLSKSKLGLDGIWWGIAIGACIRSIWMFLWYLWEDRKIVRKEVL